MYIWLCCTCARYTEAKSTFTDYWNMFGCETLHMFTKNNLSDFW